MILKIKMVIVMAMIKMANMVMMMVVFIMMMMAQQLCWNQFDE